MSQRVAIRNGSEQSIYELVVSLVARQGAWRKTAVGDKPLECQSFVGQVPPGQTDTSVPSHGGAAGLHFAVEIAFVDSLGRSWLRHGDGRLIEWRKRPSNCIASLARFEALVADVLDGGIAEGRDERIGKDPEPVLAAER